MKRFRVVMASGRVLFVWCGAIRECARNHPGYARIERVYRVG